MFKGIIPPLVTPLRADRVIDREGAQRLVEHVLEGGVHGVFVLGTSGEGPALSHEQQKETLRTVCHQVNNRVPVLVGITHSCYAESIRIAQYAADQGADAVVVAPQPYYSSQPSELLEYLRAMVKHCPLPVVLYNMPANTQVNISWRTVEAAAKIEGIVGFKDSSGDMVQFQKVRMATRLHKCFSTMVGPEELIAESMLLGSDGGIPGGSNVFPKLYSRLYDACSARQMDEVYQLQKVVIDISRSLYEIDNSNLRVIKTIKACLAQMGICESHLAFPFSQFNATQQALLVERLERIIQAVDKALLQTTLAEKS